ncbi:MAG: hypothetical protein ABF254_14330 [Octadecabacter sp.]
MERIKLELTCFKAYDIRGRLGIDLDEGIAYRIGAAFAVALNAKGASIFDHSRGCAVMRLA